MNIAIAKSTLNELLEGYQPQPQVAVDTNKIDYGFSFVPFKTVEQGIDHYMGFEEMSRLPDELVIKLVCKDLNLELNDAVSQLESSMSDGTVSLS